MRSRRSQMQSRRRSRTWRGGGQHADAGCNGVKLFQDVALDSRKVEVVVVVARLAGAKQGNGVFQTSHMTAAVISSHTSQVALKPSEAIRHHEMNRHHAFPYH